jgi:hypothetical protein
MEFKKLLMALCLYVGSAKGMPALQMCRLLDMQDKTATVLTGKLRECLIHEMDTQILSGVVEIDGGYFCGKPRKGRLRFKTRPEDVAAALEAKLDTYTLLLVQVSKTCGQHNCNCPAVSRSSNWPCS